MNRRTLLTSAALGAGASLLKIPRALADAIPTAPSTPHFDADATRGATPFTPVETPTVPST